MTTNLKLELLTAEEIGNMYDKCLHLLSTKGIKIDHQEAFIEHFAVQCGYCTPGMILMAKALLDENPDATEDEIKAGLSGNLCRCTGYAKIVEAVMAATGEDCPRHNRASGIPPENHMEIN